MSNLKDALRGLFRGTDAGRDVSSETPEPQTSEPPSGTTPTDSGGVVERPAALAALDGGPAPLDVPEAVNPPHPVETSYPREDAAPPATEAPTPLSSNLVDALEDDVGPFPDGDDVGGQAFDPFDAFALDVEHPTDRFFRSGHPAPEPTATTDSAPPASGSPSPIDPASPPPRNPPPADAPPAPERDARVGAQHPPTLLAPTEPRGRDDAGHLPDAPGVGAPAAGGDPRPTDPELPDGPPVPAPLAPETTPTEDAPTPPPPPSGPPPTGIAGATMDAIHVPGADPAPDPTPSAPADPRADDAADDAAVDAPAFEPGMADVPTFGGAPAADAPPDVATDPSRPVASSPPRGPTRPTELPASPPARAEVDASAPPNDAPDDALETPSPAPALDLPLTDTLADTPPHPATPEPPAVDPWFDGGWTAPAPRPAWHGAGRRDDADPLDAPDDEARLAGIADDLLAEGQLSEDGTMLADVLADSDHGSRRARLRALIAAGATEDTIYAAWAVRETWNATHPYTTGLSLGWNAAYRIADAFHGYPSAEEVLAVLEPLEHAYRHARRRFGSYPGPFEAFLLEMLDADFGNAPAGDDLALRLGLRVVSE